MANIYHTLVNPNTLPSLKQRQTWLECAGFELESKKWKENMANVSTLTYTDCNKLIVRIRFRFLSGRSVRCQLLAGKQSLSNAKIKPRKKPKPKKIARKIQGGMRRNQKRKRSLAFGCVPWTPRCFLCVSRRAREATPKAMATATPAPAHRHTSN